MKDVFDKVNAWTAQWALGRYGFDNLNYFLLACGFGTWMLSWFQELHFLAFFSLAFFLLVFFRAASKDSIKRAAENMVYLQKSEAPKKWINWKWKAFKNRKTTCYFKCEGCGQILSVPKDKGKLRVVCPVCKKETYYKS